MSRSPKYPFDPMPPAPTLSEVPLLLSQREAALYSGASLQSVRLWVRTGQLRVVKTGTGQIFVARTVLAAFVEAISAPLVPGEPVVDEDEQHQQTEAPQPMTARGSLKG